jgi:hypothetical protein
VEADDAVGTVRRNGHVDDRKARRVGSEDRVVLQDRVQLLERRLLEVEVLGDGLEDDVAIAQIRKVRGRRDAFEDLGGLGRLHAATLDGAIEAAADAIAPGRDGFLGDLVEDDVEAGAGRDLADAGAHGSAPDDPDLGDLKTHEELLNVRKPRAYRATT